MPHHGFSIIRMKWKPSGRPSRSYFALQITSCALSFPKSNFIFIFPDVGEKISDFLAYTVRYLNIALMRVGRVSQHAPSKCRFTFLIDSITIDSTFRYL